MATQLLFSYALQICSLPFGCLSTPRDIAAVELMPHFCDLKISSGDQNRNLHQGSPWHGQPRDFGCCSWYPLGWIFLHSFHVIALELSICLEKNVLRYPQAPEDVKHWGDYFTYLHLTADNSWHVGPLKLLGFFRDPSREETNWHCRGQRGQRGQSHWSSESQVRQPLARDGRAT